VRLVELDANRDDGYDVADLLAERWRETQDRDLLRDEVEALVRRSVAAQALRMATATQATNATKATPTSVAPASVASVASVAPPPPPLPAAYYGLAGRIVDALDPLTEADRVGVLGSLLVGFGNACGRGPHVMVGRVRHGTNLQLTLVGNTSSARKGTAWAEARFLLSLADPEWKRERMVNGLVSGEGVIHHVRDPVTKPGEDGDEKTIDAGVTDKRLMCVEDEYGRVLAAGGRQGSTLLHVLRSAWDGDRLGNLTRNSAETASGAHISVLGHVTAAELLRDLTETDRASGFANRVLWLYVRRSKELPFGGELSPEQVEAFGFELRQALEHARRFDRVEWGDDARAIWVERYPHLTRDRPGLTGAILSRAEAQVLRLALVYALLDRSRKLRAEHVGAALALWGYAENSVRFVFSDMVGDPVADAILAQLRRRPDGVSRTEIRDLFHKHGNRERIEQALSALENAGLARTDRRPSGGRPIEMWFAIAPIETTTPAPETGDRLGPCSVPGCQSAHWRDRNGGWHCLDHDPPAASADVRGLAPRSEIAAAEAEP
jgi:hypothetical protein